MVAITPEQRRRKRTAKKTYKALLHQRPRHVIGDVARQLRHLPLYVPLGLYWVQFLVTFGACLYVGKLAVSGLYYALWETHVPLAVLGPVLVGIGAVFIIAAVAAVLTDREHGKVSMAVGGLVLVGLGVAVIVFHAKHHNVVDNTAFWHWWVSDDDLRHNIRAVFEGLVGGLLWVYTNWNHFKRTARGHWYDRIFTGWYASLADNKPTEAWQLVILLPLVCLFAIPGFLIMWKMEMQVTVHAAGFHNFVHTWIPWHINANPWTSPTGQSIAAKAQSTVSSDWAKQLMGFAAAYVFGRIPAFGPMDDFQGYMAQRRLAKKGSLEGALAIWQLRGYQARITDEYNKGGGTDEAAQAYAKDQVKQRGAGVKIILHTIQFVFLPLAILGWYVLTYLA